MSVTSPFYYTFCPFSSIASLSITVYFSYLSIFLPVHFSGNYDAGLLSLPFIIILFSLLFYCLSLNLLFPYLSISILVIFQPIMIHVCYLSIRLSLFFPSQLLAISPSVYSRANLHESPFKGFKMVQ